ncbi:type II toxin-antitoxin system RelE/ParE family toxin [Patescibacteria group bacterium]|nr:type II toxin-antitoxin system RelE/ParE family toxin [Patescibacteria group bacterium]MBU2219470.1 type II toxin-antitoxin system RelE/ParE family toxin [Patescibacteria group bacterium]MBU2263433.1 type II toxin-antitoxin system RelE/ParE family toxin [Patescibacteria group bacterium]
MSSGFRVFTTPAFDRELKKFFKKDKTIVAIFEIVAEILRNDPINKSKRYEIKKLIDVKQREGQWRIRQRNYRVRYDIFGNKVVLQSIRDRRDSYK